MQLQRLLPVFLSEADEHLQALEEGALQLERHGPTPELVAGLFRSAHTLKGSAGALGFQRIAKLAHAVEEVLEAFPGTNCGACGLPGCEPAAAAVVAGDAPVTVCRAG
ncbi:MAG: Hpt domain-containing protein, partial [Firmicutes bacterium]|nr:Hpt domain-containing protein [Bacillota bacterium]